MESYGLGGDGSLVIVVVIGAAVTRGALVTLVCRLSCIFFRPSSSASSSLDPNNWSIISSNFPATALSFSFSLDLIFVCCRCANAAKSNPNASNLSLTPTRSDFNAIASLRYLSFLAYPASPGSPTSTSTNVLSHPWTLPSALFVINLCRLYACSNNTTVVSTSSFSSYS
jgi:hypothetical protein